jgi:hypothetical protein
MPAVKRSALALAALGPLVVAAAACGSSHHSSPKPAAGDWLPASSSPRATAPAGGSRAELEAAVRAYSAAYLGGDGAKAYDLLSARCQQRMGRDQMDTLTAAARRRYGPQDVKTLTVDQLGAGLARVTYTFSSAELDQQSEPWVWERGGWREDDC